MKERQPPLTMRSDDIDLLILLEKITRYFRQFGIAYLVAIIAGVLLGIGLYSYFPKLYRSRMVLQPAYLTNQNYMQIIDGWNELLKNGELRNLATVWNCDENMLDKLADIDAIDIMKVFTPNNPNGFYVEVKVTDNSILPALQNAVLYGLNNSDYVKQKVAVRIDNLKQMINDVTKEITKVDSIKTNVENIISNKEKNSSSLMIDVSGLNRELIDLKEKLLGLKEELKFVTGVHLLQGFSRFDKPVSISLKVFLIIGLIFCLALTYFYTLVVLVRKRMRTLRQPPDLILQQ